MASVVAHIVYAARYFEKYPSNINKDGFLMGCVFPDIRKIDKEVERRHTHQRFSPVNLDFRGLRSFEAGWKFHLYCDMRRDEILRNENFYSLKDRESDHWNVPAKMLEDQFLYHEYNNWEKVVIFFNNAPFLDPGIDISKETFGLWYAMLAKYFEKEPDDRSMHIYLMKQHGLPDKVEDIISQMGKIRQKKKAVEILRGVIEKLF